MHARGLPLGRQEGGLLAAYRLCINVVRALRDGNGLPLEELRAVVLDKEGCTAFLGARLVGSIKLDKQRSGGWWGVSSVEEHFALPDASCCFDSYVDATTAAVVVIVGDVRLLVWRVAMLVQEAVSGVVLIGAMRTVGCAAISCRAVMARAGCSWPARCSGDSLVMAVWMRRVHPGSGKG